MLLNSLVRSLRLYSTKDLFYLSCVLPFELGFFCSTWPFGTFFRVWDFGPRFDSSIRGWYLLGLARGWRLLERRGDEEGSLSSDLFRRGSAAYLSVCMVADEML